MPETRDQQVPGESGNRNDSLRMAWRSALPGGAVAAEATEETPRIGDVAGDLGAQLFRARKFLFFAEALPEAYLHALCSDFPGKIEQIRFDAERSDIASLLVTEAKIFTHQHGAHTKAAHENLLDEVFGGEAREIQREGKDDGRFEPDGTEPVHALRVGGEAQGSGFRAQNLAGRGVEGQRGGNIFCFARALNDGSQDGLMAQVNAVEVADGQNAAASGGSVMNGPFFG